jgi:WD40 repeat protein
VPSVAFGIKLARFAFGALTMSFLAPKRLKIGICLVAVGTSVVLGYFLIPEPYLYYWYIKPGQQRETLPRLPIHHGDCRVAWSSDSRLIAAGGGNSRRNPSTGNYTNTGFFYLWDTASKKETVWISNAIDAGHDMGPVEELAFSSDGRSIASLTGGLVALWDRNSGQLLHYLGSGGDSLAYSLDGKMLASGGGGSVTVWKDLDDMDHLDKENTVTLEGHTDGVRAIAFSPNCRYLASGGSDKMLNLWEVSRARLVATLTGHSREVTCVAFSKEGDYLASGSFDGTIMLWNVETREHIHTFNTGSPIYCLSLSPDGRTIASGEADGGLQFWDVSKRKKRRTLYGQRSSIRSVAYSGDGKMVATGGMDGSVFIWDAPEESP